jgi:hypothetical protein
LILICFFKNLIKSIYQYISSSGYGIGGYGLGGYGLGGHLIGGYLGGCGK